MKLDIWDFFSKTCLENPSFIKIRQEWRVLYMKTFNIYDSISLNSSYNEKYFRQQL